MKRLSDIRVSYEQILDFAKVHAFDGSFDPTGALNAGSFAPIGFITNMIISKGSVSTSLEKTMIQYDCDVSPDFTIIVQAFLYLNRYPDAQKMLWHYLTGNGEELSVDSDRVFREDPNMRDFMKDTVKEGLDKGELAGYATFKQWRYSDQNWRNAFGTISIRWAKLGSMVQVWFDDTYAWHPLEPRVSQGLHQAMDRAKKYGAKEFYYSGTRVQFYRTDFDDVLAEDTTKKEVTVP